MTIAGWESVGTLGAFLIAALVYAHLATARPTVRCFVPKPHLRAAGEWHVLGYLLYVTNVGRAPAILLSAGLSTSDSYSRSPELPPELAAQGPLATFPLVLQPGEIAQVFVYDDRVDDAATARFGAQERVWRGRS